MKIIALIFCLLLSGSNQSDTVLKLPELKKPVQETKSIYTVPIEQNNAYNKAKAKKLKYRNLTIMELDTIKQENRITLTY